MRKLLFILFTMIFTVPAFAMEIDFSQKILDADGKPFRECLRADETTRQCAEVVEVTLGMLSGLAISQPTTDPRQSMPLDQSYKRGELAFRLKNSQILDLPSEDIAMIKDGIGKLPINKIEIFRAVQLLDPVGKK